MPLSQIPESEKPRTRCLTHGASHLSLRECIAVLLGTGPKGVGCMGLAEKILERLGGETSLILFVEKGELPLSGIRGLGPAGRARIQVALEMARRLLQQKEENSLPLQGNVEIENFIPTHLRQSAVEWIGFVPFDAGMRAGELCVVDRGSRMHVNTDTAELFRKILIFRPSAIALYHNHPSGNLDHSRADLELTYHVRRLCLEFGIEMLGHWIVGARGTRKIPEGRT